MRQNFQVIISFIKKYPKKTPKLELSMLLEFEKQVH